MNLHYNNETVFKETILKRITHKHFFKVDAYGYSNYSFMTKYWLENEFTRRFVASRLYNSGIWVGQ